MNVVHSLLTLYFNPVIRTETQLFSFSGSHRRGNYSDGDVNECVKLGPAKTDTKSLSSISDLACPLVKPMLVAHREGYFKTYLGCSWRWQIVRDMVSGLV